MMSIDFSDRIYSKGSQVTRLCLRRIRLSRSLGHVLAEMVSMLMDVSKLLPLGGLGPTWQNLQNPPDLYLIFKWTFRVLLPFSLEAP